MRASIIMSMLLARPIATELTGDRELLEHSQFLDPKRTTADDHKILRIPKWGLLPLTLQCEDRLELFFEGRGHGQAFDDHVVQGHEKDKICRPDPCVLHTDPTAVRCFAPARLRFEALPAWRKGIHSRDNFKNLNHLVVPRQRRNKFLLLLPDQRRRIDSDDFFILFVKLAIFESIANGLPED